MRILITTDTTGGVWTFARELSVELLGAGCSVALVSLGYIPSPAQLDWVAAQVTQWGSRFRFAASDSPLEWMQNNHRARREAEPLLLRLARDLRADLIISNQFCFGALPCETPRVVVAHSDMLSWAACGKQLLPESRWLGTYKELVAEGLERADAVVAPTQWMLDALGASFRLPGQRKVIANGRTVPPGAAYTERKMQAASAGRLWDEGKNLTMLAGVRSPMPILVAGEMGREAASFDRDCGEAVLLGPLDEAEMLALLRQSAVYICTSQYEPFGLAPLEAALCGCAVLANDIPSLREVWGQDALFFHDAESLSALLAVLAGEPELLARAQANARRRAQMYTSRRMAERYIELCQEILQPSTAEHYVA